MSKVFEGCWKSLKIWYSWRVSVEWQTTAENVDLVGDLVLSQEGGPQTLGSTWNFKEVVNHQFVTSSMINISTGWYIWHFDTQVALKRSWSLQGHLLRADSAANLFSSNVATQVRWGGKLCIRLEARNIKILCAKNYEDVQRCCKF